MTPDFSIIITTYNRIKLLQKAIDSVFEQTIIDWELVIVNDCSTDGTEQFLNSLNHPQIKVVNNPVNLHKGGARNIGIDNCSGQFVCFLDDDDYYLSHHLEVFAKKIKEVGQDFGLMFTQPISQKHDSNVFSHKNYLSVYDGQNAVAYLFHHKNGVPTPRACVPLKVLKMFPFNPNIRIGQDTELFMRIAAEYPIYPILEHTSVQVNHDNNSGAHKYNSGLDRLKGYDYIFSNPKVSSKIPKKLKNYMISYCYRRMCEHYNYIGNRRASFRSALMAFYYSPFDKDWKIKLVDILYNFPLMGKYIQKIKQK
jgi:glycosyltransferase involved in cell wall biosynthesis